MGVEAQLTEAGIIPTDARTIFRKDLLLSKDVLIKGNYVGNGLTALDGNIIVGGRVTSKHQQTYTMAMYLPDLNDVATSFFLVTPSDGAGYISMVRFVLWVAHTGTTSVLTFTTAAGLFSTTLSIPNAAAGVAVEQAMDTAELTAGNVLCNIVAGSSLITVDNTAAATTGAGLLQVEITRDE